MVTYNYKCILIRENGMCDPKVTHKPRIMYATPYISVIAEFLLMCNME